MAHNDAPPSKAIKLTPEEDINSEEILDTVRSVASSKGKDVAVIPCIRNCIRIYFIYCLSVYIPVFNKLDISVFSIQVDDEMMNLVNLPTEVIENSIFPYLRHKELIRIRLNKRLSDIANSVIEKRDRKCKYKLHCLQHEKYNPLN